MLHERLLSYSIKLAGVFGKTWRWTTHSMVLEVQGNQCSKSATEGPRVGRFLGCCPPCVASAPCFVWVTIVTKELRVAHSFNVMD